MRNVQREEESRLLTTHGLRYQAVIAGLLANVIVSSSDFRHWTFREYRYRLSVEARLVRIFVVGETTIRPYR